MSRSCAEKLFSTFTLNAIRPVNLCPLRKKKKTKSEFLVGRHNANLKFGNIKLQFKWNAMNVAGGTSLNEETLTSYMRPSPAGVHQLSNRLLSQRDSTDRLKKSFVPRAISNYVNVISLAPFTDRSHKALHRLKHIYLYQAIQLSSEVSKKKCLLIHLTHWFFSIDFFKIFWCLNRWPFFCF